MFCFLPLSLFPFSIGFIADVNNIKNNLSVDFENYSLNQFLDEVMDFRILSKDELRKKVTKLSFEEQLVLKEIQDKIKNLTRDLRNGDNSAITDMDRLLTECGVEAGLKYFYIYGLYNKYSVKAARNEYVKDSLKFLHLSARNGFEKGVKYWTLNVLYDRLSSREDYLECRSMLDKHPENEDFIILKKWLDIILNIEKINTDEINWVIEHSDEILKKYPKMLKDTGALLIFSKTNLIDAKHGLYLLKKYAYDQDDVGTLLNIIYISGNMIERDNDLLQETYRKIKNIFGNENLSCSRYLAIQGWDQKQDLNAIHNADEFIKYCLKKINETVDNKGIKYLFK